MKEMLPHISKNVEEVLGSLGFFLPELLLGALFLLLILADLLLGRRYKNGSPIIAFAGVLIITLITCFQFEDAGKVFFGGMLHLSVFRSEEHTSELQSLMRISYAVFCLKKKKKDNSKSKR